MIHSYCNDSNNLCQEAQCQASGLRGLLKDQLYLSLSPARHVESGSGREDSGSAQWRLVDCLSNWKPCKVSLKPGNLEREARKGSQDVIEKKNFTSINILVCSIKDGCTEQNRNEI